MLKRYRNMATRPVCEHARYLACQDVACVFLGVRRRQGGPDLDRTFRGLLQTIRATEVAGSEPYV